MIMRVVSLVLVALTASLVESDDISDYDYGGNYPDDPCFDQVDQCNYYDDECSKLCHHNHFPATSMEDMFGPKVTKCCEYHGYIYTDQCDERPQFKDKKVCSRQGHEPQLLSVSRICPTFCQKVSTESKPSKNFTIDRASGKLSLPKVIGAKVENYCVSYECDQTSGWAVGLEACLCSEDSFLNEVNRRFDSRLTRCCPSSLLSLHDPKNQAVSCLKDLSEKGMKCASASAKIHSRFEVEGDDIVAKPFFGEETRIAITDENYCIGPSLENTLDGEIATMNLYVCEPPCNGNVPCIRTCCNPGYLGATCENPNNSSSPFIIEDSIIARLMGSEDKDDIFKHLMAAHYTERQCEKGKVRMPYLNPQERCNDAFELRKDKNKVVLHSSHLGQTFSANEFCLNFMEGNFLSAEVCRESLTKDKFKFYPYVLMVSCFFLLVTLMVYSIYPKLLNNYTRIMRHFTFAMFLAFACLSINQLVTFGDKSPKLCVFFGTQKTAMKNVTTIHLYFTLGYAEQYLFLVSFTLMTAMSVEIWMQTRGNQATDKRYRLEMLAGYGFPLTVTVATLLVETFAERCSDYRPRFGEEQCFFTSVMAKGIWFFLPIGLMLLVNTAMFTSTVVTICSLDRRNRALNLRSGDRNERMERFLLFLKLFLGMGFIWTFEIIAGLFHDSLPESTWYVTDILNMLQGFYIFAIFVCKRNVLNVIMKKRSGFSSNKTGGGVPLMPMKAKKRPEIVSTSGCGHSVSTHVTET